MAGYSLTNLIGLLIMNLEVSFLSPHFTLDTETDHEADYHLLKMTEFLFLLELDEAAIRIHVLYVGITRESFIKSGGLENPTAEAGVHHAFQRGVPPNEGEYCYEGVPTPTPIYDFIILKKDFSYRITPCGL